MKPKKKRSQSNELLKNQLIIVFGVRIEVMIEGLYN